jgi:hypothetical protein
MLSMSISAMMMGLLQQQVTFHQLMRAQDFLVKEAPLVNNSLTHIMARADAYRIHGSLSEAVADVNALTEGGKVLVVGFQDADGDREFGIISFETYGEESYLGYYNVDPTVPFTNAGSPDWLISRSVSDADFFVQSGVFRVRLTGPNGETITYSGTPRL